MSLIITCLLAALALYGGVGLLFGIAFVTRGVTVVDPVARGSSFAFRALILPGAAALWPMLLSKWLRAKPAPGSAAPSPASDGAP